jgi:copper chaperone CopZ
MEQMTLAISGMSCGGCVTNVRTALGAIPGARVDTVAVGSATVSYDVTRTTPAAIAQAVRDAGYDLVSAGTPVAAGATDAVDAAAAAAAAVVAGDCCGDGASGRRSCC